MVRNLPIICSAHHASNDFGEFTDRCALTSEQRLRYSDYGTADTVPQRGMEEPMVATHSRGVVDLNRSPRSPTLFPKTDFDHPLNQIWKPGQELTKLERTRVLQRIYHTYHDALLQRVRSFKRPGIVVAWDNTAHYEISNATTGEKEMMSPFILSNRGTRDSADMTDTAELDARRETIRTTSCDPRFLEELSIELRKSLKKYFLPNNVRLNRVYKGGFISERYNTRRHPEWNIDQRMQSLQIEYNTLLTHNQTTLDVYKQSMVQLRVAVERALCNTYANLLTWNIYR